MVQNKKLQLKVVYSILFFSGSNSRVIKTTQSSFYPPLCLMFLFCIASKLRTVKTMKSYENFRITVYHTYSIMRKFQDPVLFQNNNDVYNQPASILKSEIWNQNLHWSMAAGGSTLAGLTWACISCKGRQRFSPPFFLAPSCPNRKPLNQGNYGPISQRKSWCIMVKFQIF